MCLTFQISGLNLSVPLIHVLAFICIKTSITDVSWGRMTSHRKVFEDVVSNALKMPDDNQAINFACTQLECMYQFTTSHSEVKAMCSHAVKKFYEDRRFRGNDHVLRIFQVLIRVSQNMGASGIYEKIEQAGYFKNSLKFHVLWAEAEGDKKNQKKFKEIWTLARQRIPPSKSNVDSAFREVATNKFPEICSWFEDEDPEKTLNIFAPSTKNRRRSSVAFLERAAVPSVPIPPIPSMKTIQFMSKSNPLRAVIVDRDDGYRGISAEEYRVAKTDDLADMDITVMHPIEEEPEMDMETEKEENIESKKMRIYSPVRQPLHPKQDMKAPSPLVAHTSFTSNFYNKAMNAFSETMKVEEVVHSPMDKPSDATYDVQKTPSSTSCTPSASKESFAIFIDEDEEKEDEKVMPPPPPIRPRGLSARPSVTPSAPLHPPPPATFDDDPFDDNEPTVAGFNRGKQDRFLTSTPAIRGFDMDNEEPNFWMDKGSDGGMELDLNLSAIDKDGEGEKNAPSTTTTSSAGSAFARKRKSFGGGVVGDKARSSIGPKGGAPNQEIDNAVLSKEMNCMKIGGDEKINPWDRDIRGAIMSSCSIPVNRHDLAGTIKQPKNGQKMELGGEIYSLDDMIGEGGFAKVFLCTNEKKELLAMKYETPSCEWEVYILEALRKRVRNETVMESLMQVTDAFIYKNCSLILSEYLPMGTLLQSANNNIDPHWSIVVYLGMQMANVLKDVHAANIIHGDAKPDNWMIMEKINEDASIAELLESRNLRLIDWGRAIDMKALGGRSLYGRAGTENFDCIEMMEDRPWTYHPDFYSFCGTVYVLHMKEYMTVSPSLNGRYAPLKMFKRRVTTLALWTEIFDECFNIPEGAPLPSWSLIHEKLKGYFVENMDRSAWKEAVRKFNKSLQA
ncbi:bub-1 [Pristionchus pacificus]|uniref:Protein kinase domain-containing protein n=1 Tax=Pristionchus pacificus TaxID=54126 RepID=A0A8R1Z4A0_PRIPA|nr:bub-1 [Pristionchus pacificus]